jgi:hypothetical protein
LKKSVVFYGTIIVIESNNDISSQSGLTPSPTDAGLRGGHKPLGGNVFFADHTTSQLYYNEKHGFVKSARRSGVHVRNV